jgi:hypothetical protein
MSRRLNFALGSFVIAAIFLAFANFGGSDEGDNGGWTEYGIALAVALVAAALVFWLAARYTGEGAALVFAVLSAITVVAFWLGVTPVFAGAAAYLTLGQETRTTRGTATLVLAGLATVAFAVLCITG